MKTLRHKNSLTEWQAANAIFNVCRANENREPRAGVTFNLLANGEHEAALRATPTALSSRSPGSTGSTFKPHAGREAGPLREVSK